MPTDSRANCLVSFPFERGLGSKPRETEVFHSCSTAKFGPFYSIYYTGLFPFNQDHTSPLLFIRSGCLAKPSAWILTVMLLHCCNRGMRDSISPYTLFPQWRRMTSAGLVKTNQPRLISIKLKFWTLLNMHYLKGSNRDQEEYNHVGCKCLLSLVVQRAMRRNNNMLLAQLAFTWNAVIISWRGRCKGTRKLAEKSKMPEGSLHGR